MTKIKTFLQPLLQAIIAELPHIIVMTLCFGATTLIADLEKRPDMVPYYGLLAIGAHILIKYNPKQ